MCGIFAAMTRHGLSSDRCDAALKLLQHRGPDGTAISLGYRSSQAPVAKEPPAES